MLDHLQTEARNPASAELDKLSPLEFVQLMCAEDAGVVPAVQAQAEAIARAIEVIADRLRAGGRLIYIGAGTSGRLGVLDASECPPTFNSPPEQVVGLIAGGSEALTRAIEGAEDHPEFAERDLAAIHLSAGDVLVGIAASGRTPYVQGGLAYARQLGAFTIGVSCNLASELLPFADLPITPVVGPEVVSGSTRLKSGTATKLVLNMLTTGAMVRLGKTYGNLMVDLRATNSKLRLRTNRIVRQLTGLTQEAAQSLLECCGGELKTALVAQLAQVTPEEARARLSAANGQVGLALGNRIPAEANVPHHADLVLGIDGGGTSTIALVARGETILGEGVAGPSNLHSVGRQRALQALDDAIDRAFTQAGIPRGPVASACLGLAGSGRAEDRQAILDWATNAHIAEAIDITSDGALLLAAGTPDGCGVAVVAGTGSIVVGQSPSGELARAGGWGYLLGDEGSGYHLVMAALRAITQAADGRAAATALQARLLEHLGLSQPQELVNYLHRGNWDRAALAGLAPLVLETADAGDAVAKGIAENEARQLAETTLAVIRKLQLAAENLPLALAGGVLISNGNYRALFLQTLEALGIHPKPVTLVSQPAQGAIRLALRQLRR